MQLKGCNQLLLVWKLQTNKVVFTAVAFVPGWLTSPITHQASVRFHTKTQGLWPIITTYYSGKWIPHICFQWMARLTLVLAYSILLHKPLANRCLCWSEWTLKLRPAACVMRTGKICPSTAEGKVVPNFVYNCQILASGFVEQFGSKPKEFSNVLVWVWREKKAVIKGNYLVKMCSCAAFV